MTSDLINYSSKLLFIPGLCLLLLYHSPVNSARLYKWIDDKGQIRYSDRLPASQSKKRHQTLYPDGRIQETTEAAIPPEQLERERAEKKRVEEEARLNAEQIANKKAIIDQHDNVLLMTFGNETEIVEAQIERLTVIDSVISLLRKNIKNEQQKLDRQEKRAYETYIAKDLAVPGGLAQNIEYIAEKTLGIVQQLRLKLDERDKIKNQYAIDLLRYRELTQNPDKRTVISNP